MPLDYVRDAAFFDLVTGRQSVGGMTYFRKGNSFQSN